MNASDTKQMLSASKIGGKISGQETKDVSEQLKGMMMLYMTVPFKRRVIVQQDSPTAMMQTKRIAKEIPGFDTIEFVDSIHDVLK
jgi:hypothetical protein